MLIIKKKNFIIILFTMQISISQIICQGTSVDCTCSEFNADETNCNNCNNCRYYNNDSEDKCIECSDLSSKPYYIFTTDTSSITCQTEKQKPNSDILNYLIISKKSFK